MIFKLLIVDDEATMRKGLSNYMNWDSIDCEVAAAACDGLEAIDVIQKTPIDIVITDIKMPVADGLEIARFIYENKLNIKVILLTGYADFAYAQTAIRYNVSSFILKPTNKKTLFEAVQEAQKDLIISRKTSSGAAEELAFLKDQLLQEMTDQPFTDSLQSRMDELSLSLDHYCIAAFRTTASGDEIASLKRTIIEEEKNAYCYRYNSLIITVYFLTEACRKIPAEILENCREITAIARTVSARDISIGLSSCHSGAHEFRTAVSEAILSLPLNFYSDGNIALFCSMPESDASDLTAENSMDLLRFENHLNNRQFDGAEAVLSSMFMKFKSNFTNSMDAKNICTQIYYICARVLLKKQAEPLTSEQLTTIHRAPDIFALEQTIRELVAKTSHSLLGEAGSQNKLVSSAIQYIHGHIAEPLSLESISEQLHISPSHLSRTFKRLSHESLTEYINKARIEKAKEYLDSADALTYEVAELVGYNDPTYFSSMFRKYTGQSPTEYRQGRQAAP